MLPFTVALPVEHPPRDVGDAERTALVDALHADVAGTTGPSFGLGSPSLRIRFATPGRTATAAFPGQLTRSAGGVASIELFPGQAISLLGALPDGCPAPRRVTVAPVAAEGLPPASGGGAVLVSLGDPLGTLTGDTLELAFLDEHGAAIDPSWCLRMFDTLGVWDLPDPTRNPLLAPAALPAVVSVLGAGPATGPALTVRSATGRVRFIHPPTAIRTPMLPFVASDTITVGLLGVPAGTRWRAVVEDLVTGTATFTTAYTGAAETAFEPRRDLLPPGPITAARRLRYRITVQFESPGTLAVPPVEIQQDIVDQLRQEYEDLALTVPPRARVRPLLLQAWPRVDPRSVVDATDYEENGLRYGVEPDALAQLAEALACAFERILHPPNPANDDPRSWCTSDLVVLDGYHSPSRHLDDGLDAIHPAIQGAYLLVRPRAERRRGLINEALVDAAVEVLDELQTINAPRLFRMLEVQVLDSVDTPMWSWRVDGTGVTAGPAPTKPVSIGDSAVALQEAHTIALFFPLADPALELLVPEPRPKEYAPPPRAQSVIVLGEPVPGSDDLIPVDDSAETLRAWLDAQASALPAPDRDLPAEVVIVRTPIELFRALGVIGDRPRRIRHLVTMTHAYAEGLLLFSPLGMSVPPPGWPTRHIHSEAVADQLRDLYGHGIEFGTEDDIKYATHQFRVVNLTSLPGDMRRRLRANLADAEGTFLIGCNTNPPSFAKLTITRAFADVAGRTTWGARITSKFQHRNADGIWVRHDEELGVGAPGQPPVVLLPEHWAVPPDAPGAPLPDLLKLYRQALLQAEPEVR